MATVSFDREGHCRLLLSLDRPTEPEDVAALEEAADALPYLQLSDLEGGARYPQRHADAFALPEALPSFAFNSSARIDLVTRPGGIRLPARIGSLGLTTHTTVTEAPNSHAEFAAEAAGASAEAAAEDEARNGQAAAPAATEPAPEAEAEAAAPRETAGLAGREADTAAFAAGAGDGETAAAPPPAATAVASPAEAAGRAGGRMEGLLGWVGDRLVAGTRLSGGTLGLAAIGLVVAAFVGVFVAQTWALHRHFGTYGFDLGIYDQGTWLLSRLEPPFVTVRGLDLFGEHASYILVLVAPLYRIWADPRLLLLLQALALAMPAWVIYRLGARHLANPAAGLAVAVAYLAFPGMQWALTWQFHPETLAAAFLALAALAADGRRYRLMTLWLALALLCREDVGLVVAGFGGLLMLSGQKSVGRRVLIAGLAYWVLATFLFIPWANARQTNLFEVNYGVTGVGPIALLRALPSMAGRALATALSNQGLGYLLVILVGFLGLPLLAPRTLLPVAPALFLNLAAVPPEQHQIRYQYLATVAPFLGIATVAGLKVLAGRRRALLAPALVALVVVALAVDQRYGPAPWSRDRIVATASPSDQARRQALAMIPPDVPVSAQYNLVPHLTHRVRIYEFPNPFRTANWGLSGDVHPPRDPREVRYVVVDRGLLDDDQRTLLRDLQASPDWATRFAASNVVLLERRGNGP